MTRRNLVGPYVIVLGSVALLSAVRPHESLAQAPEAVPSRSTPSVAATPPTDAASTTDAAAGTALATSLADASPKTRAKGETASARTAAETDSGAPPTTPLPSNAEDAAIELERLDSILKRLRLYEIDNRDMGTDGGARSAIRELTLLYSDFDPSAPASSLRNMIKAYEARRRQVRDYLATMQQERSSSSGLVERLGSARRARCYTAYCFGGRDGAKYALEPMLDLPIGTSFALGDGSLSAFTNSLDISIQFSAGLRFWFLYDLASVSIMFAKPVYSGRDTVRLKNSSFEHPTSSIRRIGPSIALGFFGDVLFLGGGYDVLTNGPGTSGDPNYGPNDVLSRTVTVTLGLAPFAAARNVAGAFGGK